MTNGNNCHIIKWINILWTIKLRWITQWGIRKEVRKAVKILVTKLERARGFAHVTTIAPHKAGFLKLFVLRTPI